MDFATLFKCFGFVDVNNRGSHAPDSPLSSYMGGVSCGLLDLMQSDWYLVLIWACLQKM
jgi:hypothetical protein